MIGWLSGTIVDRSETGKLLLDVHGVGYEVETSLQTFFQLELMEGTVGIYIHTIVREDALLLYGFLNQTERALFRTLIKVNGVGPKLAMAILSSTSPDEFVQCIEQENALLLTRLPGVGKKTAERLVVEMKGNLKHIPKSLQGLTESIAMKAQEEAIRALEALGYKQQEARKMVSKIDDGSQTCEQLIRQALQLLSTA